MTIRRYGPGKFMTILDSLAYGPWVLEGGSDEEVSEEGFGAYDLLRGPFTDEDIERLNEEAEERKEDPLTDEEEELVRDAAGVIFQQTEQGFVYSSWIDDPKELESEWDDVEADYEDFMGEPKEEEEEEEEEEVEKEA